MTKLLVVSFTMFAASLAFAHDESVIKKAQEDEMVKAAVESINKQHEAWGGGVWGAPTAEVLATNSDLMAPDGTKSIETIMVKIPYSLVRDWSSTSDNVVVILTHTHRERVTRAGTTKSETVYVNKVYESAAQLR